MNLKVLWIISDSMDTVSDLETLKGIKDMNIDIVTADREDKDSIGFAVTGKKYLVPHGKAPDYIESIKAICQKEKITTLIPQYGDELDTLSRNIPLFDSSGVKVIITPDVEKLSIANNKTTLYGYFENRSFIPQYRCTSTLEEMEKAILELGTLARQYV
ncbi:MAG: hypothetical protein ACM3TR_02370 [Caulobacteraceae bacterium]